MTPYQVRSSELSGELDMPFRTHNFTGQSAYLAHLRDLEGDATATFDTRNTDLEKTA